MIDRMGRLENTIQGVPGSTPGLTATVLILNTNVENLTKSNDKLANSIETLTLSNAEKEGEDIANQKNSINTKWFKTMMITLLGLIISLGVAFGTILIKYKERSVTTTTIQTKTQTQTSPQEKTSPDNH
jgi:ABC-type phosphate transport system permease subunit